MLPSKSFARFRIANAQLAFGGQYGFFLTIHTAGERSPGR
jgi:hypothetical protein